MTIDSLQPFGTWLLPITSYDIFLINKIRINITLLFQCHENIFILQISRSIKCIHNWTYFSFISSESLIAITDCKEKTCLPWPQNSLLTRSYFKSKLKNDSHHCFCSVALFLYHHKPLCFAYDALILFITQKYIQEFNYLPTIKWRLVGFHVTFISTL